jgi:hypothetical protein
MLYLDHIGGRGNHCRALALAAQWLSALSHVAAGPWSFGPVAPLGPRSQRVSVTLRSAPGTGSDTSSATRVPEADDLEGG